MTNNEQLSFVAVSDNEGFQVLFRDHNGFQVWAESFESMLDVRKAFSDAISEGRFIDAT
jgi:hypothetical protein